MFKKQDYSDLLALMQSSIDDSINKQFEQFKLGQQLGYSQLGGKEITRISNGNVTGKPDYVGIVNCLNYFDTVPGSMPATVVRLPPNTKYLRLSPENPIKTDGTTHPWTMLWYMCFGSQFPSNASQFPIYDQAPALFYEYSDLAPIYVLNGSNDRIYELDSTETAISLICISNGNATGGGCYCTIECWFR